MHFSTYQKEIWFEYNDGLELFENIEFIKILKLPF